MSAPNIKLSSREQRKKLPERKKPYFQEVRRGLAIGYRRGATGGFWVSREFKPEAHRKGGGAYVQRRLGTADDTTPSDGLAVLSWFEALKAATGEDRPTVTVPGKYLVSDAADEYFLTRSGDSTHDAYIYQSFIEPRFGNRPISELTTGEIEAWLTVQVQTKGGRKNNRTAREIAMPDDREKHRAGQATANRRFNVFRAILNSAYRKDPARVPSADAWKRVRAFSKADKPRQRVLQVDEALRLLEALPPGPRAIARGALYTGMRLGELAALKVADATGGKVTVQHSKSGKSRTIPLTQEAREFFQEQCEGKKGDDFVFDKSMYRVKLGRAMVAACKVAGIDPPVIFHDLRRSYGSLLINSGAPADVIQELLGHADMRMTRRVYAHLLQGTLQAAVDKHLPSFSGKAPKAAASVRKVTKRRKQPGNESTPE